MDRDTFQYRELELEEITAHIRRAQRLRAAYVAAQVSALGRNLSAVLRAGLVNWVEEWWQSGAEERAEKRRVRKALEEIEAMTTLDLQDIGWSRDELRRSVLREDAARRSRAANSRAHGGQVVFGSR